MARFPNHTPITRRDDQSRGLSIGPSPEGGVHLLIEMDEDDATRKRHNNLDVLGIQLNEEQARELYNALGALLGEYEPDPDSTIQIESRQITATQDYMVEIDVEPSMHGEGVYMLVQVPSGPLIDLWLCPAEADELIEAIQWAKEEPLSGGPKIRTIETALGPPTDEQKDKFIDELLGGR